MTDEVPGRAGARVVPRTAFEGWGRHPVVEGWAKDGERLEPASEPAVLSRGLGRAYGDAALPPPGGDRPIVLTPRADRILDFDATTGVLRAEAGFSLGTLREIFLARGWFTPVSPGTRHVTLGGMVAADIHGKNHHCAGCFGQHVRALRMRVGDGRVLEVTPDGEHAELFHATTGGMGLTGHILEVSVALEHVPTPWIYEQSERCGSLEEVIATLGAASAGWPMTVAWIDTTARGAKAGRGLVMRGRWATADEAPSKPPPTTGAITFPFDLPSGLINPWTIGLMNTFWYHKHGSRTRTHVVNPDKYFWPLDGINRWNRAFGRRGFTQYQCVMPSSAELYREFLEIFQRRGGCSFVTVFKDCGEAGPGPLSFPQRGTSMTLDIPVKKDGSTQRLCAALDEFVVANGGRIYLAKDAFVAPDTFRAMYPKFEAWRAIKQRYDPEGRLRSAQSVRLEI
ncbi:MAG: FAD-binding oxidoreductase [Myxococcota bacterium]